MSDKQKVRSRSPNYPYISLEEALSFAGKLYKQDKQNYVPVKIALSHMGLSVTSSTSQRIISAMLEYGLLEGRGERDAKEVIITNLAKNIIIDDRPDSTERLNKIREATLNSKMMRSVWDNWHSNIPAEDTIKYKLISKWEFTDRAAARFTKVIQENFKFAKLEDYIETKTDKVDYETAKQLLTINHTESKPVTSSVPPKINLDENWLDFNLSLGAKQQVRLMISKLLTEDDFQFLLTWINRLKNDIVENNNSSEAVYNNDDIEF